LEWKGGMYLSIGGVKPCWPFRGFGGWRVGSLASGFAKSETPNQRKVPLEANLCWTHWDSTFWHFRRQGIEVPCSGIPGVTKRDTGVEENAARCFSFRHFTFRWVEEPKTWQGKSQYRETRRPELAKGMNLLWSRRLGWRLVFDHMGTLIRTYRGTPLCVCFPEGKSKSQWDSGGQI